MSCVPPAAVTDREQPHHLRMVPYAVARFPDSASLRPVLYPPSPPPAPPPNSDSEPGRQTDFASGPISPSPARRAAHKPYRRRERDASRHLDAWTSLPTCWTAFPATSPPTVAFREGASNVETTQSPASHPPSRTPLLTHRHVGPVPFAVLIRVHFVSRDVCCLMSRTVRFLFPPAAWGSFAGEGGTICVEETSCGEVATRRYESGGKLRCDKKSRRADVMSESRVWECSRLRRGCSRLRRWCVRVGMRRGGAARVEEILCDTLLGRTRDQEGRVEAEQGHNGNRVWGRCLIFGSRARDLSVCWVRVGMRLV
ncbi:hypothetical protein K438DRAFT_1775642 [Mycena galopus ATCC 62051]|nr:hypothetical protein K438DRAFT_1775642 [Mycena galopus ATCC 62051]